MKKKWQDPEYRARQEQAIRASHKANPRRPRTTRERAPTTTQPRTRRKKLPPLQKRLRSDKKAFEDTLQELQQTRAYCAKFEGVVSKLQAQVGPLLPSILLFVTGAVATCLGQASIVFHPVEGGSMMPVLRGLSSSKPGGIG